MSVCDVYSNICERLVIKDYTETLSKKKITNYAGWPRINNEFMVIGM